VDTWELAHQINDANPVPHSESKKKGADDDSGLPGDADPATLSLPSHCLCFIFLPAELCICMRSLSVFELLSYKGQNIHREQ
jgi:hypothetical protein